jgi:3-oxoadipate enol-lactonase
LTGWDASGSVPMRDVDGEPVAWREAGDGALVVFLHGLGMTRSGWDAQLSCLADRYRCVAWDMPGYGASAAIDPLTFTGLADAAAGLIGRLDGAAHLVGLSLGGQIALHTAINHPQLVRSLALLDTSAVFGADGTDPAAWVEQRLAPLGAGATPGMIAPVVLASVMAEGVDDRIIATAAASMARISRRGLEAAIRILPTHDVRDALATIRCRTLVLVGEHDTETPPAYASTLAAAISDARLVIVPGAGHLTPYETPRLVCEALREHLV